MESVSSPSQHLMSAQRVTAAAGQLPTRTPTTPPTAVCLASSLNKSKRLPTSVCTFAREQQLVTHRCSRARSKRGSMAPSARAVALLAAACCVRAAGAAEYTNVKLLGADGPCYDKSFQDIGATAKGASTSKRTLALSRRDDGYPSHAPARPPAHSCVRCAPAVCGLTAPAVCRGSAL